MSEATQLTGIVAIVRLRDQAAKDEVLNSLSLGGITNIEITLGTPECLETVARWRGSTAAQIGVGTVRTDDDARRAISNGAQFLVTPTTVPSVLAIANDAEIPVICGALTPTEIDLAWSLGAAAIKVFPANSVGGPEYLKSIMAPMPDVSFMPTGGVDVATAQLYAELGCTGVGVGSALVAEDLVATNRWDALASRAKEFVHGWGDGLPARGRRIT
ncbi:bifunctional 4-hydroxy-2-oxoglutarate aldolase/2-dehydro-3-deoxy-phosphogluconate aldolase [Cryobacterium sp. Y50]|uniref:bifunctional 4-hydroxy-2-oxoglutarate aldolase/2-dehydro-3-deoxy-phosphogluconate aldolase n=1 Tax=Cryobacterium sp. Y50 TaxID=2048286 RepID=UPI0018EDDEDC|nr:bifunctional 4-hydroxy-2-oxoglutarate aldolase/2-dehydro-3-deoxy-phosphogluconate aldolase [Cryobacterium sp. Y50]